ncbi:MAG: tetratricopeptide repeat protein, partial [Clostridia bacterium]|nr:tetratricopeptide repeat protein [Clostridia bacterium]
GGFPKDFNAALKYFSVAAEMGHVDANYMLGFMYECGHVKKDLKQAIEYYSRAADQGNYLSAVQLAFLYQQEGYISYDKAFYYARSAAEHGVMEGEFVYGVLLLLGRGCEPDSSKAVEYLNKAFEHGIYQAKFFLEQTEKLEMTSIESQHSEKTQYYHFKGNFVTNDRFSGRDKELEELKTYLKESRVCFVSGVGGIGKTELVKQYASENREKYDRIIFMKYTSDLTDMIISDQYFEINGLVRKRVNNEPESDEGFCRRKLGMIKNLLSGYSLLIIDNFDTEYDPMLKELLDGPYQVILTTRMNYERLEYPVLNLERMSDDDQLKLFYKYSGKVVSEDDIDLFRKIVSGLNGHTLTIELVAKQFAQAERNAGKLMGLVQTVGINAITNSASENDSDGTNLIYEYICQLFREEKLSADEKTLLLDMSLLPISGVSLDRFMEWCEVADSKTVEGLIGKSWLQYDPENGIVSMHPLIVEMIKNELGAEMKLCETMLCHLDRQFSLSYYMKVDERTAYGEIAKALYRNIPITKENLNSFRRMFWIFKDLDYIGLCEELYTRVKIILEDKDSIDLAWWYWDYGDLINRKLNFDKALEYMHQAIDVLERVFPDSYDLAYLYKHQAHIYHNLFARTKMDTSLIEAARKCLTTSEMCFKKCISGNRAERVSRSYSYARNMEKDCDSQRASLYYAKGLNLFFAGDYNEAERLSQKSLEIFERINGRSDADTTAPLRVLARIYAKTGRIEKAISLQKEVVEVRGKIWGKNQYLYYENLEIMADMYHDADRSAEAIQALKKVVELIEYNPLYADYLDKIRQKINLYEHSDDRKDHQEV